MANEQAIQLTAKQRDWVNQYTDPASDGYNNAAESARLAGYSKRAARQVGYCNTTKGYIVQAIEAKRASIAARSKITLEEVVGTARWLIEQGKAQGKLQAVQQGNEQLCKIGGFTTDQKQSAAMPTINVHMPEGLSVPTEAKKQFPRIKKETG